MARTSDKAAHWAEVIRRYRHSGLTQAQFCRENDISYHCLRWWLHQPRARRAMEDLRFATDRKPGAKPQMPVRSEVARFLPVRFVKTAADREPNRPYVGSAPPILVLLGGGRRAAGGASPSAPGSTLTSSGE